jgi:hypothetical protein
MPMRPGPRKLALTAHVASSVGWIGGVACFLALAIAGLANNDELAAPAAYVAMDVTYRYVIVPLGLASLLTGLVSSLGTEWGLVRHYWVLTKLLLSIPLTILLFVHTRPVGYLANAAAEGTLSNADLGGPRIQLVADSGAALLALLVAMTLALYKPAGVTGYRM